MQLIWTRDKRVLEVVVLDEELELIENSFFN
jgi:hypothetical protein